MDSKERPEDEEGLKAQGEQTAHASCRFLPKDSFFLGDRVRMSAAVLCPSIAWYGDVLRSLATLHTTRELAQSRTAVLTNRRDNDDSSPARGTPTRAIETL